MILRVEVFYNGWNEHWHWGTLAQGDDPKGPILFEYTEQAIARKLELSRLKLPLGVNRTFTHFPQYQSGLPGIIFDALPDGWGMRLLDQFFLASGMNPGSVSALTQLAYLGDTAMGALSFQATPLALCHSVADIPLDQLATKIQTVLQSTDAEYLRQWLPMGACVHGARPKLGLYRDPVTGCMRTVPFDGAVPWLVMYPAPSEHPEVCALEQVYACCARLCGLPMPETHYLDLGPGLSAFGVQRFDRQHDIRLPLHSLAGYLETDYRSHPCDYADFLRVTGHIARDERQVHTAFEQAVFNVLFNNRNDHPGTIFYVLDAFDNWKLAPPYEMSYGADAGGDHQMSLMGKVETIRNKDLLALADVAGLSQKAGLTVIERFSEVALSYSDLVRRSGLQGAIRASTLRDIQDRITANVVAARS